MSKRFFLISPAIVVLLVAQAARAFACAVCLSGADDAITEGYNASVLFLLATPYAVGACIAAGLVFTYRQALKRRQNTEEETIVQLAWKQEESSR
jgi:hypothetical protein